MNRNKIIQRLFNLVYSAETRKNKEDGKHVKD